MNPPKDPRIAPIIVTAFQLAESISIRACRSSWKGNLLTKASQELFYGPAESGTGTSPGPYTYILNYGVVIYAGRTESEMAVLNAQLQEFCRNPLETPLREEFQIHAGNGELAFGYNEVRLKEFTGDALRIVMLHVGQSVALDYYETIAENLLRAPDAFIGELERHGRLKPSRKTILRYIGRTLSARNRIIETLYVLDAPESTWDNPYLDRLDRGMKKTFDIQVRFRSIRDHLNVAKENLVVFAEILQNRESNKLEWIIIVLILIEVIRMVFFG